MTEICENNKMHYFNREMDFRKTEWPSLGTTLSNLVWLEIYI